MDERRSSGGGAPDASENLLCTALVGPDTRATLIGSEWHRLGVDAPSGSPTALADVFHAADLTAITVALHRLDLEPSVSFDARLRRRAPGERPTWLRFRAALDGASGKIRIAGLEISDLWHERLHLVDEMRK